MWQDENVQLALKQLNEFPLLDSAFYWFPENIKRVVQENYVPTELDILNTRVPTLSIKEYDFNVKGTVFRVVDVGGARSQRNKWLRLFAGIDGVIFVASLSSYAQYLEEQRDINRLHDSLGLFDNIINNPLLKDVSIILFLNKVDLFKKYLRSVPLSLAFDKYTGNQSTFTIACA